MPRSSHLTDIEAVIKRHYAEDTKDNLGLKIAVTGMYEHRIGAGSCEAWKLLFNDLEAKLAKYLKKTKSSCQDGEGQKQCLFCRRTRQEEGLGSASADAAGGAAGTST